MSEKLQAEILINPTLKTLTTKLRVFLTTEGAYRHIIFSGQALQHSGCWVLQDALFTLANLAEILRSSEVSGAIKQGQVKGTLAVNTFAEGDWSEAHLGKLAPQLQVRLNLPSHGGVSDLAGYIQFGAYLSYFLKVVPLKDLLQSSSVVGNIRFSRPTLYIFPSCQGDSALFGISGFNLLVNGGYGRKACFWDFTRHLDRIDAMLVSHLGPDNLFGVRAVVARKAQENVHPEIGYVYMNAVERGKPAAEGDAAENDAAGGKKSTRSLLLSLGDEASGVVEDMKTIGTCAPRPCVAVMQGANLQPTNLYHKVGHGTLDMFVLSPTQDSKALKDFLAQWSKRGNGFSAKGGAIPACHSASVCAILVWKPASPHDMVTRILFPGSAPQSALFEGLDRLKNVALFQYHTGSDTKGAKKGSSGKPQTPKPPPAKSPAPPKQEPPKKAPPKKEPQKGGVPSKGKDDKGSDLDKKSSTPSSESKSPVGSKQPLASPGSASAASEGVASAGAATPDEDNKENQLENGRDGGDLLVDLQSAPPPETVGDLVDLEEPSGGMESEKPDPDEKDVDTKEVGNAPGGAFDGISPEGLPSPTAEGALPRGQVDKNRIASKSHQNPDSAAEEEESPSSTEPFDPSKHWGAPMDLPAPSRPTNKSDSSAKGEEGAANDKPPALDLPRKKTSPTKPQSSKPLAGDEDRSKSAVGGGSDPPRKSSTSSVKKGRPGTAPTDASAKPAPRGPAKKPATSASGPVTKPATLKPVVPFYVDLAYVPGHGSTHYLDIDFFRRVRARYYVLSTLSPDAGVLTALLEAKQMWDDPESEVTIIPTYDADVLRYWMAAHRDQLSQWRIDVAPSANRCSIQLQDHETSCAAYRLEF